ncbi:hypothetical protein Asp14428_36010 [Actinoplanes sp. NBRC 14428]|uniref:Uncharacterized protein n=1 Tax=Pseudosporangium ferrugineum TaxID=439699 RepID=A0A2T0S3I3_9ACTN|nr:hypothetical protein [Pseudosporangium ferrugineum]PRY27984.1 hypothetical protein CLV70_109140 [Pseudosporangium ferrugineum]BCJ52126.1 hypothetical protein Asp14428_36010 [Actinoplanes sp. NBRC 14428]
MTWFPLLIGLAIAVWLGVALPALFRGPLTIKPARRPVPGSAAVVAVPAGGLRTGRRRPSVPARPGRPRPKPPAAPTGDATREWRGMDRVEIEVRGMDRPGRYYGGRSL